MAMLDVDGFQVGNDIGAGDARQYMDLKSVVFREGVNEYSCS